MGWERRGGRLYFYRKRRAGGRVISDYICTRSSRIAAVWDLIEADRRLRRASERELRALDRRDEGDTRAALDALEAPARAWYDLVEAVARAALEAAGYHRPRRGPWRKRRRMSIATMTDASPAVPAPRPTDAELKPLVERGRNGDRAAVAELLRLLHDDPERFIRLGNGNVEALARHFAVMRQSHEHNAIGREALGMQLDRLRAELEGPHPTPLERLLAARVALTWFHLNIWEIVIGHKGSDLPEDRVEQWERRRERAQRMHLAAIKTLAQVRKLQLPSITQVNLAMDGGQQVNLAGR